MAQGQLASVCRGLIRRVQLRLRLAGAAQRAGIALAVAAGLYGVLLLASRLGALVPDVFTPVTLLAVPGVALVVAALWHDRPSAAEAARRCDEAARSKDLFLTAVALEGSAGAYQPLVMGEAEAKASAIRAEAVAPYRPGPGVARSSMILAILAVGVLWLPQLDPWGQKAQADLLANKKEQIKAEKQLTLQLATQLAKAELAKENSPVVEQKVDALTKAFNQMKPTEPKENLQRLAEQRQALEEAWRQASEKKLKDALGERSLSQKFGGGSKAQEMKEGLKQGNAEAAKKELAELQKKAEELAKATDPVEKQKLRQEIKQGLQQMQSLAAEMDAASLSDALQQAQQQLDMSSLDGLSQDAMQAMQQSLGLSQMEMQSLAQNMRDLQKLQEAMKTLQTASSLNQLKPLDGKECSSCSGLAQYAMLYQQMLSQCQGNGGNGTMPGQGGNGGGMGGPGRGQGGVAPENQLAQNNFQTEKSASSVQAGKILMSWKTREVSEAGEASKDYRTAVADVKQGVTEAILQEQVPPGYHEAIKRYFDDLDASGTGNQSDAK